jgi:DtxR family Mn-dependent transcriptional regulator
MENTEQLSASLEDYLETIYLIVQKKRAARAKDIADQLQVKASSVTAALRLLSDKNLIHYAPYDIITLTAAGERLARNVLKRHEALFHFLHDVLGVDPQEAESGACKLEHAISPVILKRLISFVDFVQQCPRVGTQWVKEFNSFCQRGAMGENCRDCIADCFDKLKKK